jgi:hypothetical protein
MLSLLPFRDYLYAALAVVAVVFWFHHDHVLEARGAASELVAVQKTTKTLQAQAQAQIASLTKQHDADVAKVQATYEQTLASNNAQHNADLKRLRDDYESHSASHASLAGTSGATPGPDAGAAGAVTLGNVPAGLTLELADALRADDAQLTSCWADRDSLTGK